MKGYLSVWETSYKWNVSERRANQYVTEELIPGEINAPLSTINNISGCSPALPQRDVLRGGGADPGDVRG